jgi:mono/diheme cytochrome c family protein
VVGASVVVDDVLLVVLVVLVVVVLVVVVLVVVVLVGVLDVVVVAEPVEDIVGVASAPTAAGASPAAPAQAVAATVRHARSAIFDARVDCGTVSNVVQGCLVGEFTCDRVGMPVEVRTVNPLPHIIAAVVTALAVLAGVSCGQGASESAAGRGAGLYRANCSACHGDSLGGTSLGPSLLDDRYRQLSDDAIRTAIRAGVEPGSDEFGAMPGNAMLRDTQVDEIITFVRSQQRAAASTPP